MPTCDEKAYEALIQKNEHRDLVLNVLAWLHLSRIPIGMEALCEALAVEQGYYQFRQGVKYDPSDIQEWCRQLIYWNEPLDLVKIVERGCHEYLSKYCGDDMSRLGGPNLAMICLTRLLFEDAKSFPAETSRTDPSGRKSFIDHALLYWPLYVKEATEAPETRGLVAHVLLYNKRVRCSPCQPLVKGSWNDGGLADAPEVGTVARESQSPLHMLIGYGLVQTAYAVLHCQTAAADLGLTWAEVESLGQIDSKDDWGQTLLHYAAASSCDKDFIVDLLEAGAKHDAKEKRERKEKLDVNARNVHGFTALHCAAYSGNKVGIEELLKAGADQNITGAIGTNALHLASAAGHLEIIKFLIQAAADAHALDDKGQSALHYAAAEGHGNVLKYLIDIRKLDVNQSSKAGYTPLHISVMKGLDQSVKILISRKADVSMMVLSEDGPTALELAAESGWVVPAERLIWAGATLTIRESMSNTVARWANLTHSDGNLVNPTDDAFCHSHFEIPDGSDLSLEQLQHMMKHFPDDAILKLVRVRKYVNVGKLEAASDMFNDEWEFDPPDAKTIDNISHATAISITRCDDCGICPIRGYRYKCLVCTNWDCCQACFDKRLEGSHSDPFLQIPSEKFMQSYRSCAQDKKGTSNCGLRDPANERLTYVVIIQYPLFECFSIGL